MKTNILFDIVFTGGGTAGHVTPNLAVIPDLQEKGYSVAYIGQSNSIEERLVAERGIPFYPIAAGKLRRYIDFQNLTDVFKILLGLLQSLRHLYRSKPKVVFSKGGFVSSPVVWAAWLLGIPVIIHESDMTPGLANKLSLPFAKRIAYSFPETKKYLPTNKSILTGVPIRDSLAKGNSNKGKALCNFQAEARINKPCILVIGGSLGAKAINKAVRTTLNEIIDKYNICHLCGQGGIDDTLLDIEGYSQFEYLNEELKNVFAMADIVISRAGATSIFELLFLQKPNLLIPLPLKASRGDQILNAASFKKQGFSKVLDEEMLSEQAIKESPRILADMIDVLYSESKVIQKDMQEYSSSNARIAIIDLIVEQVSS